MSKDRKERLKELLDKQKHKTLEEESKKEYQFVLEVVKDLFPNSYHDKEEVEILSEEDSKKISHDFFNAFPFCHNGIDWRLMFYKATFSNYTNYESALAEVVIKNLKFKNETACYIIDPKHRNIIKTKLINVIHRMEEIRAWAWDGYIYSPQKRLVIGFPSNDIVVGWKE